MPLRNLPTEKDRKGQKGGRPEKKRGRMRQAEKSPGNGRRPVQMYTAESDRKGV